jgi:hypothetical protein
MWIAFLTLSVLGAAAAEPQSDSVAPQKTRVLVVDLAADPALSDVAARATEAIVRGLRTRTDMPIEVQTLADVSVDFGEPTLAEIRACRRGSCMTDAALAADVDAVVFGELRRAEGARPFVVEIRVLSRTSERVTAKAGADAADGEGLVDAVESAAQQVALPKHEIVFVEPPKPRDIFEEPLFVSGATVAFIGGMMALAAAAYAIQSEMFLANPDIHRDIKSDALVYGPWSIVVAGVATSVALIGVGMAGASFFLPASE